MSRTVLDLVMAAVAVAPLLVQPAQAQQRITAPDAQPVDWFGYDIAVDGDRAVIGAWRDDDRGVSTGSIHLALVDSSASAAYDRKLLIDGARAGDMTGFRVAVSDDLIAASCPGRVIERRDGAPMLGAVVVFGKSGSGWEQIAVLDSKHRKNGDLFGAGIAIEGDTILVGAPRDDEFALNGGAVYVFKRSGGSFGQHQKIAPADIGAQDFFGHDVAMSDGRAVVTAYNDDEVGVNAGAAYVLESDSSGAWSIIQKLVGSEGGGQDLFGTCCDMDGDTIVIGAPQNEDTDALAQVNEGAAFVYDWSARVGAFVETHVLRPGDPDDEHRFGIDVAVQDDVIVVGASHSDANLLNSGSAHVFVRSDFDRFESLRHGGGMPQAYDYLGLSVAAGPNTIVVGVPGANDAVLGGGAVDVIDIDRQSWGSTFCHASGREQGLSKLGGARNRTGRRARLTAAGGNSIGRGDLVLRATGVPAGAFSVLYVGSSAISQSFQLTQVCVGGGALGVHQVAPGDASADERYVVRGPLDIIGTTHPGQHQAMAGSSMFAQVLYLDGALGRWSTTNALRMDLVP